MMNRARYGYDRGCSICRKTNRRGSPLFNIMGWWGPVEPKMDVMKSIPRTFDKDVSANSYTCCGDCIAHEVLSSNIDMGAKQPTYGFIILSMTRLEGFPSEWHIKRAK